MSDISILHTAKSNMSEAIETSHNKGDSAEVRVAESVFSTQLNERHLGSANSRKKLMNLPRPAAALVINTAQLHYAKGLDCYNQADYCQAIHQFNKALSLCPDFVQYLVDRAECYFALCDLQSAIVNYRRVCLLQPQSSCYQFRLAAVYYFQAESFFVQNLFSEALENFSRSAELKPENIGCEYRSIACLAALRRYSECLALVNKMISQSSATADLYVLRARLHEHFRNVTLCYYDVHDALVLDPEHVVARQLADDLLARAERLRQEAVRLSLLGRHKDALQQLNFAISSNPASAEFHVFRGTVQRQLHDYNAAIDDFLLAFDKLQHDETLALYADCQRQLLLTYNDFAIDCFSKGFYDEAVLLLNKAIHAEKTESGLYVNRGDCFYRQGNIKFALLDFLQAEELSPGNASIAIRLALVYNDQGLAEYDDANYKEANDSLTKAIQHNPLVADYYISRSRCRQMMANQRDAQLDIVIALLLEPTAVGLMSSVVRLFAGNTVTDILSSPLATKAKQLLQAIDPSSYSLPTQVSPVQAKPLSSSFSLCLKDRDLQVAIVDESKRMNKQVRQLLDQPGIVKPSKVHIGQLPEPSDNATYGGGLAQPSVHKQSGWRQFNHKVGSLL